MRCVTRCATCGVPTARPTSSDLVLLPRARSGPSVGLPSAWVSGCLGHGVRVASGMASGCLGRGGRVALDVRVGLARGRSWPGRERPVTTVLAPEPPTRHPLTCSGCGAGQVLARMWSRSWAASNVEQVKSCLACGAGPGAFDMEQVGRCSECGAGQRGPGVGSPNRGCGRCSTRCWTNRSADRCPPLPTTADRAADWAAGRTADGLAADGEPMDPNRPEPAPVGGARWGCPSEVPGRGPNSALPICAPTPTRPKAAGRGRSRSDSGVLAGAGTDRATRAAAQLGHVVVRGAGPFGRVRDDPQVAG